MSDIQQILHIAKPHWKRIIIGVLFSFIASGLTAAIAWVVKPALDVVFIEKQYHYLKLLPAALVLLYVLKGFFEFAQTYMMKSVGFKIVRDVRVDMYQKLIFFPMSYFTKESSGKILSRIINDVNVLSSSITKILVTFTLESTQALMLAGLAFYRRWDLALLTIILLPFAAYGAKRFGRNIKKKVKDSQMKISDVTHRINETVSGVKMIKVFGQEGKCIRAFAHENQSFYRDIMKVVRLKEFTRILITSITGLSLAVILWYGGDLVVRGELTAGDFFSFFTAVFMLFSPVRKIGEDYSVYQEVLAVLERIDTVKRIDPEPQGRLQITQFQKSIKYDNVSFMYPETNCYVLENINLEIAAGEAIAIVGPSGAGKTTFVDLIPKFYAPTQGAIYIDGQNLTDLTIQDLRKLIGIVSQDIILFDESIKDNIAIGNPNATIEEIEHAAKLAYAHDFIKQFAQGYETLVGERGARLSGGQKQRIAIARAILKNPPILILDEATSALDSISEKLVQKAIEELMQERTTIIIAHRLSTIRNANRIVALHNGKILAIGAHEELMATCSVYATIYNQLNLSNETSLQ
jgi:subfamily B ATP-binding cassette protein MsbA